MVFTAINEHRYSYMYQMEHRLNCVCLGSVKANFQNNTGQPSIKKLKSVLWLTA